LITPLLSQLSHVFHKIHKDSFLGQCTENSCTCGGAKRDITFRSILDLEREICTHLFMSLFLVLEKLKYTLKMQSGYMVLFSSFVEFHLTSGCPWPSATVKFYKFYFFLFFTLYLVYSFLEKKFLLKLFYCISLSLFHLFPFLFYSFCIFTFFLVYVCFMFFYFYVFIYLVSIFFFKKIIVFLICSIMKIFFLKIVFLFD